MRTLVFAGPTGLLVLGLAACGSAEQGVAEVGSPTTSAPSPDPAPVFEADVTVLEQRKGTFPKHGPMLCLWAMALSYPPQCGDVSIANWDWKAVDGEEEASGGPLCVIEEEGPTKRELNRIRTQAETYVSGGLKLQMLGSSTGGVGPVVEIEVVADPEGAGQAALNARWPGLVRLFPVLRPVEASR